MTATKTFHIGDVLSITHDRLVSPEHIGGVYKILGWMTGEELMTHQLPRASRECEPFLRAQHPDLTAVEIPRFEFAPDATRDECEAVVMAWLDTVVAEYGETREVEPLPPGEHTSIDPIAELKMMRPDAPVITVNPATGEVGTA